MNKYLSKNITILEVKFKITVVKIEDTLIKFAFNF